MKLPAIKTKMKLRSRWYTNLDQDIRLWFFLSFSLYPSLFRKFKGSLCDCNYFRTRISFDEQPFKAMLLSAQTLSIDFPMLQNLVNNWRLGIYIEECRAFEWFCIAFKYVARTVDMSCRRWHTVLCMLYKYAVEIRNIKK